jgi:hypothetical protein
MWDTAHHLVGQRAGSNVLHLSHDLPCPRCGHAMHRFLPCSETCRCVPPPVPGMAVDPYGHIDSDLVLLAIA